MITIPLSAIITAFLTIGVRLSGLMLFAPFSAARSSRPA